MVINHHNDILTIEEFMDYLAIARTTAYKLLKSGQIKSFKIGRVHKIPKISIDEYIERMRA